MDHGFDQLAITDSHRGVGDIFYLWMRYHLLIGKHYLVGTMCIGSSFDFHFFCIYYIIFV